MRICTEFIWRLRQGNFPKRKTYTSSVSLRLPPSPAGEGKYSRDFAVTKWASVGGGWLKAGCRGASPYGTVDFFTVR